MSVGVKQMMDAANAVVPRITPAQGRDLMAERKPGFGCARRPGGRK